MVKGRNTDDVQYLKEADSYPHLFACYLLSAFGIFTEGKKSASHCMAGNKEVIDLWEKFSSEGMTKMASGGALDDGL